ncbi:MAG: hypothetical protein IJ688_02245 [Treponema sp.]|nr:hypothetical protein [Treponema sp.]
MAKVRINQNSFQTQNQRQRLSHRQIQALQFLAMNTSDLRDAIYKEVSENPALEIVRDNRNSGDVPKSSSFSQEMLENSEDKNESLQQHLLHQLNSMNLSEDEYQLSQKLIYNLDENGCYGSLLSPETLIDKTRPLQNREMLYHCMDMIQRMDPVGTCCRTPEESLLVQARISGTADELSLFLLDGHLELLNPPEAGRIVKKLTEYRERWHKKAFAPEIVLDRIPLNQESVEKALHFILSLNPRPAQGYVVEAGADYEKPDVILSVEKVSGSLPSDEIWHGLVSGDENCHFQIKYASGVLPELRISPDFSFDKENVARAKEFIENLSYRENTLVLQCCYIVKAQRSFFLKGPGNLNVLSRRQLAENLGLHESTVSRMSARGNSKYIQTEFGLFPTSYFFTSGVSSADGSKKVSAEKIKNMIVRLLEKESELSDSELTLRLNKEGIKIARRTVAKYRAQIGIKNSYYR